MSATVLFPSIAVGLLSSYMAIHKSVPFNQKILQLIYVHSRHISYRMKYAFHIVSLVFSACSKYNICHEQTYFLFIYISFKHIYNNNYMILSKIIYKKHFRNIATTFQERDISG